MRKYKYCFSGDNHLIHGSHESLDPGPIYRGAIICHPSGNPPHWEKKCTYVRTNYNMWIYSCYMTQYWKQQTTQGEGKTEQYEKAIFSFKAYFLDILVAKLKWFGFKHVQSSFSFNVSEVGGKAIFWSMHPGKSTTGTPKRWRFGVWKIKCLFNWVIFRFQPLSSGVVVTLPET